MKEGVAEQWEGNVFEVFVEYDGDPMQAGGANSRSNEGERRTVN